MTDAKPHYALTQDPGISFSDLRHEKEFIKWKFFYFTKVLLLNQSIVTSIIEDHSFSAQHNDELRAHLLQRIMKLRDVLTHMPEFQTFMVDDMPALTNRLMQEMKEYNQCNAFDPNGKIKSHRAHRYIDPSYLSQALNDLTRKITCIMNNQDKDKEIHSRSVMELVMRIQQESLALLYLWGRDPRMENDILERLVLQQCNAIRDNVMRLTNLTDTPYLQQKFLLTSISDYYEIMTTHTRITEFFNAKHLINQYIGDRE